MNVNAFYLSSGGHGGNRHGSGFTNALKEFTTVHCYPWDADRAGGQPVQQGEPAVVVPGHENNFAVAVGPMNRMGEVFGRYKVGFTVWETTRIPGPRLADLANVDEVWIPSSWGREILMNNHIEEARIHIVPEGVDAQLFKPGVKERSGDRPFRFLCVAKWETRKGIDVLVKAFSKAFRPDDDVELVMHCHNPYLSGFSMEKTFHRFGIRSHAPVIFSKPVPDPVLVDLYNSCDAFVLPTRGEGWGLPILEAMSCGKPVIVTDYSAPRDFVNTDCGYPVEVESMITVFDPYFFNTDFDYGQWANPSVDHLVEIMRHVYRNPDEAAGKGLAARQQVETLWTWRLSAQKAARRLRDLEATPADA